jgi:RHS repeat-associated protein
VGVAGGGVWVVLPEQDPDGDGVVTTINLGMPGQYRDGESGLFYNWNRYYDPKTGRYITADPVGVVPGVGNSPAVPQYITQYMQSVPLNTRLQRGLNQSYTYANDNPLRFIDPMGLYGTTNCSYYQRRCQESGGIYYCYAAPAMCNTWPSHPWGDCVRQCLQELDYGYCKKKEDKCSSEKSDVICEINIHQMCFQQCGGGGPPSPDIYPAGSQ